MAPFTSKTAAAAKKKAPGKSTPVKATAKKPTIPPKQPAASKSEMTGHEHLLQSKHFGKETQARDPAGSSKAPKKNDGLSNMADSASKSMIGGRG